jgi:ABC-type nitrate/sulfonate/bicarbonate transport system substrate-binding protein
VEQLVVGSFSPSVLLRVARVTGVLAAHGLAVEERAVASSPDQFRSLLTGELDAALTSPDNVLAYRYLPGNPLGRSADVRIVAGIDRGLGLGLYGVPDLESVADLRGARVGVDVAVSGFAFVLYEMLGRAGLRAVGDYELVELGATPARLAALLDRRCAATMLNAGSDLRAEEGGLLRLASVADVADPYLGTVLAVHGDPPPGVRALAAALAEAIDAVLDGSAHHVAVAEAGALGLPRHLAERYAEGLADPATGLVAGAAVDRAGLASVLDLRRRHSPAPIDGDDPFGAALEPASGLGDAAAG